MASGILDRRVRDLQLWQLEAIGSEAVATYVLARAEELRREAAETPPEPQIVGG